MRLLVSHEYLNPMAHWFDDHPRTRKPMGGFLGHPNTCVQTLKSMMPYKNPAKKGNKLRIFEEETNKLPSEISFIKARQNWQGNPGLKVEHLLVRVTWKNTKFVKGLAMDFRNDSIRFAELLQETHRVTLPCLPALFPENLFDIFSRNNRTSLIHFVIIHFPLEKGAFLLLSVGNMYIQHSFPMIEGS